MKHSNSQLVEQSLLEDGLFIKPHSYVSTTTAKSRQLVIDYLRQIHPPEFGMSDQELLNSYLENCFFEELYQEACADANPFSSLPYI
jgi:hypothetical protein